MLALRRRQTIFLVSQCAGISDPFHFYLGYFLPLVGDDRLNNLSKRNKTVFYELPRLTSLQNWVNLGLSLRNLSGEAFQGDALQEHLRRSRWTSKLIRRDVSLVFPDSDNSHKLGSIRFRGLVRRARLRLAQQGLLEERSILAKSDKKRACIMVRANPDPLKPVAFPRHVPNLDEVGSFLQSKGWEVVFLDAAVEKPETVLSTVSSSNLLVGQYGAALAHAMWLPKGASVIEISSHMANPMPRWVYQRLAESASIRFIQCQCQDNWSGPASIEQFGKSYESLTHRPMSVIENLRNLLTAYAHIYVGRILITIGMKKP